MDSSDDDDYKFDGFQPIILFDEDLTVRDGAKLKFDIRGTDFNHSNESQLGPVIDEEIGDGALTVQCDIIKVVHGKMRTNGPPASLIVFQFAFVPHGNNNRFKEAAIALTFSAGKVHSISPNNVWTTLPSERQQERSHTISPNIEASFGSVTKTTTAYTWSRKETETIRGYAKVTGEIKALGQSPGLSMMKKRKNTVHWGLYEDEHAHTGIPSLLETAVLLEREATEKYPLGEKFTAAITLHGNVNRWVKIKDKMGNVGKWMTGGTREGRDISFDPRKGNTGTAQYPEKLEDENLEGYRHLIAVREWSAPEKNRSELGVGESVDQVPPGPVTKATIKPSAPVVTLPKVSLPSISAKVNSQVPSNDHIAASLATPTSLDTPPVLAVPVGPLPVPGKIVETRDPGSQELSNLREQLQLVKAETNWVIRVIGLLAEEKKLWQKIKELESVDGM